MLDPFHNFASCGRYQAVVSVKYSSGKFFNKRLYIARVPHSNKVYNYTNYFHVCVAPIKSCRPSYDGRVFVKYYLLLFAEIFRRVRLSIRASGVLHIRFWRQIIQHFFPWIFVLLWDHFLRIRVRNLCVLLESARWLENSGFVCCASSDPGVFTDINSCSVADMTSGRVRY